MLHNKDIVVLSDDWGRHPFSCQHLIKQLLPWNRVLWVNTIGYRRLKFSRYDVGRAFGKIFSWLHHNQGRTDKEEFSENLRVVAPICLPFGSFRSVRALNALSIISAVKRASRAWGMRNPLFLTTLPTAADLPGRIGEGASTYYCVDDFTLWPGVDGDLMQRLEQRLLPKVDLIIATAAQLQKTRINSIRPTELLTHGVDLEHFQRVGKCEAAPPVRDLSGQVVAYYGLIDERCDMDLLMDLALSMPNVTFLIVGPWRIPSGKLAELPNVRLIGRVSYDDLPAYLTPASALILPYLVNDLAASINPLKLKEYLATGLPVVSTPLPEVLKLKKYVRVASGAGQMREVLQTVLTEEVHSVSPALQDFLRDQTWQAKAEEFSSMVESIMDYETTGCNA